MYGHRNPHKRRRRRVRPYDPGRRRAAEGRRQPNRGRPTASHPAPSVRPQTGTPSSGQTGRAAPASGHRGAGNSANSGDTLGQAFRRRLIALGAHVRHAADAAAEIADPRHSEREQRQVRLARELDRERHRTPEAQSRHGHRDTKVDRKHAEIARVKAKRQKQRPHKGHGPPLPHDFKTDAQGRDIAKMVIEPLLGKDKKPRLRTFRTYRDGKGRVIPALEQATAAKRRRSQARGRAREALGEAIEADIGRTAYLNPKVENPARRQQQIQMRLAKKTAMQGERKQRRLDTEAIARYGTHYGSIRAKGAERRALRLEEEKRAKQPLLKRVERDVEDLVKGAPASLKLSTEAYAEFLPHLPAYLRDRARGVSHVKAAKKHAPKLFKLSGEYRHSSPLIRLATGDKEGAKRAAAGRPVAAALEAGAVISGASRLLNRARPGGEAVARARPDKKILHEKRQQPKTRKTARARLRKERLAARHKARTGERPLERKPGDKSRRYARNPAVRAAQKGREHAQAARGRDPSLMRPKQSDRRARKAFARGRDSERAASLRREVEQGHQVKRAIARGARAASKAEREARRHLIAWIAAGHVRPESMADDLRAIARESRDELGAASAEGRTASWLLEHEGVARSARVHKAAQEVVDLGKPLEGELEDLGVIERGAAAGRAARQGPVARGTAVHVRAGDQLPGARDVPRSAHSHPGSPPKRARVSVDEGRRRRAETVARKRGVEQLEDELADINAELHGISPTRQRGRREAFPPEVSVALRSWQRTREAHAAGQGTADAVNEAERVYLDAYTAAKAGGKVRVVKDPKRVRAALKVKAEGSPAAVERVKHLRDELARLERVGAAIPQSLLDKRGRLERDSQSDNGQVRRAAKSELVEVNAAIRSYQPTRTAHARSEKILTELAELEPLTRGLVTRKKELEMRIQHARHGERPAAVTATRERARQAQPASGPTVAKHTGFVGEKQDPANLVGLRHRVEPAERKDTGPGQAVRSAGWTGEDVRRPDPKRNAVEATLAENQRAIGQARVFQELEKFGSGITSGDQARRYAAAANQQGREFVVVNISPKLAARLAQRDHLTAKDLRGLLAESGVDDVALALPRHVLTSWEKGVTAPGAIAATGRLVTRQFLRATLPLSVMWQAGNLVDNATRAMVAGAGPISRAEFKRWERTMRELDPKRADRITALMQGHFGSRRGVVAQPAARQIFQKRRNALEAALHDLTSKTGDSRAFKGLTAIPNAAVDKAFNFGAGTERVLVEAMMGRALIDSARAMGMKQLDHLELAQRMLKDDSLVEQFQRATLEMVGDYTKNPAARMFAPIDPFWNWFKASLKFTLYTLPVKHPVKAALLAAAVTMTERERRQIGLSYLLSEQERKALHLPDPQQGFLAGAIPVGDRYIPVQPFTSFGTLAQLLPEGDQEGREQLLNPVAALAGRLFPFAQDPAGIALGKRVSAGRLLGGMAAGRDVNTIGYREYRPAASLAKSLGEAFVPGVKQVRQSTDDRNAPGLLGNPAVNPFAPRKTYVPTRKPGAGIPPEHKTLRASGAIDFTDDNGKTVHIGPRQTPPKYKTSYDAFGGTLSDEPGVSGVTTSGGGSGGTSYDGGVIDLTGAVRAGPMSGGAPVVSPSSDGGRSPTAAEQALFEDAAAKYGIDPAILWGLEAAESSHSQGAVSYAGAQGWMQFMPGTAAGMGVDPRNRRSAVFGAAKYLSQYKSRGLEGMLRAYNAGPAGTDNPQSRQHYANTVAGSKTWTGGHAATRHGGRHANALAAGLPARPDRQVRIAGDSHRGERVMAALAFMRGEMDMLDFATAVSALHDDPPSSYTIPGTPARGGKVRAKGRGATVTAGGGYAGTERVAVTFAGWSGLTITSRKRTPGQNAAVGGSPTSDHLTTNTRSYAVDVSGSVAQMNRAFGLLAKRFGRKLTYNGYTTFTIRARGGTFRVQVIYGPRVGHGDHIHIGVSRA